MVKPAARSPRPAGAPKRGVFLPQVTGRRLQAGFTLIELLAVCLIMVIVTSLVFFNHRIYSGQAMLQNFAYDVALTVRQAQIYGIAVQNAGCTAGTAFGSPYGLHIDMTADNQYTIFADCGATPNGTFESSGDIEVKPYKISQGYTIGDICIKPIGGSKICKADGVTGLDIVFQRPEPDAKISWTDTDAHHCLTDAASCAEMADIVLRSPQGQTKSVSVESNGQIVVK